MSDAANNRGGGNFQARNDPERRFGFNLDEQAFQKAEAAGQAPRRDEPREDRRDEPRRNDPRRDERGHGVTQNGWSPFGERGGNGHDRPRDDPRRDDRDRPREDRRDEPRRDDRGGGQQKGQQKAQAAPVVRVNPTLGVTMIILGVSWWLAGYRYTIDGVPGSLSTFLSFFKVDVAFGEVEWYGYLAGIPLGLLISKVQWKDAPWGENVRGASWGLILSMIAVYLFVNFVDIATTFSGMYRAETGIQFLDELFLIAWATSFVTVATTYVPEVMIKWGWKQLPESWRQAVMEKLQFLKGGR